MKLALTVLLALALSGTALADSKKKSTKHEGAAASAPAHDSGSYERSGGVPGEPDTDGCGLGWQVTQSKTIIGSITRGTTNGTIPPSFGMTSGTMGCAKHPFTKRDQAGAIYAVSNYDTLKMEMAEGRGETLDGFARTFGCESEAFSRAVQSNYGKIFEGGKASAVRMFLNVKQVAKGCQS